MSPPYLGSAKGSNHADSDRRGELTVQRGGTGRPRRGRRSWRTIRGLNSIFQLVQDVAVTSHFAGDDAARRTCCWTSPTIRGFDAIWFARGGYGASRIALDVLVASTLRSRGARSGSAIAISASCWPGSTRRGFARSRTARWRRTCSTMAASADTVRRSLDWLIWPIGRALEPPRAPGDSHAAFNLSVFGPARHGARARPERSCADARGAVDEHLYATDRDMFRIMNTASVRRIAEIRLGRVQVLRVADATTDPQPLPFDESAEQIAARWCRDAGIAFSAPLRTSATTRTIKWSRSAVSDLARLSESFNPQKSHKLASNRPVSSLCPYCQERGIALYRPHVHHREA